MTIQISTYNEALDFLFARLPMYSRIGKAALKPNLDNITILCEALGNPQNDYACIHVAGTNGKGTVSHLVAGILHSQGRKTGLHTSPHYIDFRERMKVDGQLPPKSFVVTFLNKHMKLIEDLRPSFFELGVAMSFVYFSEQNVDYAVIEVGLGGRLDSTNIIDPILSVITNISIDHTDFLGTTIPEIAFEKAGIIKKGKPVLIGEYQEECIEVFKEKAEEEGSKLFVANNLTKVSKTEINTRIDQYKIDALNLTFDINIKGEFNINNIKTAFSAACLIPNLVIDNAFLKSYFLKFRENTNYMGRWQVLQVDPTILVDSAHNKAGLKYVANYLKKHNFDKLHIVLGLSNDKSREEILPFFPKDAKYYFVKANIPRGVSAEVLRNDGLTYGLKGKTYKSVRQGLRAAKLSASEEDLIFVGGSIFVVSEVL